MSTPSTGLSPVCDRPVCAVRRGDLECRRIQWAGRRIWVVKDPLSLRYFRLPEEEFALLQGLDGARSLCDLKQEFERRFAPQQVSTSALSRLIATFHRQGLVRSDASGQADGLVERGREARARLRRQTWRNPLALRWPGFNSEPILSRIEPVLGWLFSPLAIVAVALLALFAAGLVVVQFATFRERLPDLAEFISPGNWLGFAVVLGGMKVLHEFGHALACRRCGGECHSIGMMFLFFTPCLYCDVSDAWMLPSKWQRAAIGAAGMYVEVLLASIATLVWWCSEPGVLQQTCLAVMMIGSVSTLLFNLNPFSLYDGYYILADLVDVPDLRSQSMGAVRRGLARHCLGIDSPRQPWEAERHGVWLAAYALACIAYRVLVWWAVFWLLHRLLAPRGLGVVAALLVGPSLLALAMRPLYAVYRFLRQRRSLQMIEPRRLIVTGGVALAATTALLWLPAPRHVACLAVLRPRASQPVFVTAAGQVTAIHVRPAATVFAGEPLAQLRNVDLEIQDARLAVQEARFAARMKSLEYGQHADPDVARQLASTAALLESVRSERRELARELTRLVLVAPTAGVFLPPPERHSDVSESTLPAWAGQPLAERNQGARLEAGVLVGEIGAPRRCDAILFVEPEHASDVAIGQSVSLHLPGMAAGAFRGRIVEISVEQFGGAAAGSEKMPSVRPSPLLALASSAPAAQPAAHYVARVELDEEVQHYPVGAHGDALVQVDADTLGTRMWRWLSRTFRFL